MWSSFGGNFLGEHIVAIFSFLKFLRILCPPAEVNVSKILCNFSLFSNFCGFCVHPEKLLCPPHINLVLTASPTHCTCHFIFNFSARKWKYLSLTKSCLSIPRLKGGSCDKIQKVIVFICSGTKSKSLVPIFGILQSVFWTRATLNNLPSDLVEPQQQKHWKRAMHCANF